MQDDSPGRDSYRDFYNAEDPERVGRSAMPEQLAITRNWLTALVAPEAIVLELGCGKGALAEAHPSWIGLDFSLPALRAHLNDRPRMQGDMQQLPIRSGSLDAVFSWAALEHVPKPELVMDEIVRILRPGGVCILAPAWNVRPWAARAIPIRAFSELSVADSVRKLSIPVRESLPWRALAAVPGRVWREILMATGARVPFMYRRLQPNLEAYVYTDSDAFTSMDPHAAITFFRSRGWEVASHPRLRHRLLARHEPVVVKRRN